MDYTTEINNLVKDKNNGNKNEPYNKWLFYPNDWVIQCILSKNEVIFDLFSLRNYNARDIDVILVKLLPDIENKRRELELTEVSFQNKKKFLSNNTNNDKIQITIEDEYRLKSLIEKYKVYEFISWIHHNRNIKILKYCDIRKSEILEQIYPIVKLSIRKVIGSKIISPTQEEFEEAVNKSWIEIIRYLPKIDTSKVMFSVFIGIAQTAAFYFRCVVKKYKFDNRVFSSFENLDKIDPEFENGIDKLTYQDSVTSDGEDEDFYELEDMAENSDTELNDTEHLIDEIDNDKNEPRYTQLKQSILQYSFDYLSKTKSMTVDKIFAEFFIALINNTISNDLLYKHSNTIIDCLNINELNISKINNVKASRAFSKMLKDYVKIKIKDKLEQRGIKFQQNLSTTRNKIVDEIIVRELEMIKVIMENRDLLLKDLFIFRNNCLEKFPI